MKKVRPTHSANASAKRINTHQHDQLILTLNLPEPGLFNLKERGLSLRVKYAGYSSGGGVVAVENAFENVARKDCSNERGRLTDLGRATGSLPV
jgi:hypothetical protein